LAGNRRREYKKKEDVKKIFTSSFFLHMHGI